MIFNINSTRGHTGSLLVIHYKKPSLFSRQGIHHKNQNKFKINAILLAESFPTCYDWQHMHLSGNSHYLSAVSIPDGKIILPPSRQ